MDVRVTMEVLPPERLHKGLLIVRKVKQCAWIDNLWGKSSHLCMVVYCCSTLNQILSSSLVSMRWHCSQNHNLPQ